MTAEIAVFNRSGIALAADSAVTTTNGFAEKIYNNADKLFELSRHHPVALMIYNNASICNAPWELLIKAFRKQLGKQNFSHISGFSDSFFSYIQSNSQIVTADMQKKFFFSLYSDAILPPILKKVQDEDVTSFLQQNNAFPSNSQYHGFVENRVNDKIAEIASKNYYQNFDQNDFSLAKQEIASVILQICALRIAPDTPVNGIAYPQSLMDALITLFALYTCKESDLLTYSGIVFAGYGEHEYYPVIESHHVYGLFNGKVMKPVDHNKNNHGHSIGIYPFAQDDEVISFMQGCSQETLNCVHTALESSFNNIKSEVTSLIMASNPALNHAHIESVFDAAIQTNLMNAGSMIENHITINNVQKVLSILGALAKVDLGYMAESLVNLTAFKRKISHDSDSVGGPIDVAVLSKGDGFVWMKRKHYFNKELNYQYFNRQ
ncbi:hypothetical protein [Pantoea agglomerans]|uniref:hypothetical protein n=1 Tax=Enterobacter agglomerans TaxID=549 RepID=UPI003FD61BEA